MDEYLRADRLPVGDILAAHTHDPVSGLDPGSGGRSAGLHLLDGGADDVLTLRQSHNEDQKEGDDEVHDHAGHDERDLVVERVGVVPALERRGRDLVGAERPGPGEPVLGVTRAALVDLRLGMRCAPLGFFLPRLRDAGFEFFFVHAGDPHVAAQRQDGDAVYGLPHSLLDQVSAETEAELLHAHARGLRHDEMTELVGQDQEPQPQDRHHYA